MTRADAALWDAQAATFDDEADHGLSTPSVRAAWLALLREQLPQPPGRIIDLGCGTGSLATLLAAGSLPHVEAPGGDGYDASTAPDTQVVGFDLSARMVERAVAKAREAGVLAVFAVADAQRPPLTDGCADVVLVRHLLWVMPDPVAALARWARLLRPSGRLVLVEGHWSTGAGLTRDQCVRAVRQVDGLDLHEALALTDASLWGRPIEDERYLVTARRRTAREQDDVATRA